MSKAKEEKPTTAEFYKAEDAVELLLTDSKEETKVKPKTPAAPETEEVPEEEATKEPDATDQESADEDEGDLDKEDVFEDDTSEIAKETTEPELDELFVKALELAPEDTKGELETRFKQIEKGVDKVVAQAKKEAEEAKTQREKAAEAEKQYKAFEYLLADPKSAPEAMRTILEASQKASGLTAEQLLGIKTQQEFPEASFTDSDLENFLEHGYESKNEMAQARRIARMEQADARRERESKELKATLEAKERADAEAKAKAEQSVKWDAWADTIIPKVSQRIARDHDGFKLTGREIKEAMKVAMPKSTSEAQEAVERFYVKRLVAHIKNQDAPPPQKKRESPDTRAAKGKSWPSTSSEWNAEKAAELLKV